MKPTKIEKVEPILWDRWLLLKIYCEDGTISIGEGSVHGWHFSYSRQFCHAGGWSSR